MRTKHVWVFWLFTTPAVAQTPMPFIGDSTRSWTTIFSGTFSPDCLDTWTTSFWFAGDSVLNGLSYARVRSRTNYYRSSIWEMCSENYEYDNPNVFVREDSGLVYACIPNDLEMLIYDFSAEVGDSIPEMEATWSYTWVGVQGWREVLVIDSLLINNEWRRRWIVDTVPPQPDDTVAVIEGIGCFTGPFTSFDSQIGLSHFQDLVCAREQGVVVYGDTICALINSIAGTAPASSSPPFPNPSSGKFDLDARTTSYRISTLSGELVVRGYGSSVDLSDHSSGVYIVEGWTSGGEHRTTQLLLVHRP